MFARTCTAAVTALLAAPLLVVAPLAVPASADARDIADACPPARVQPAHFSDVPSDNVHALAVDCVAWWDVAAGRGLVFGPGESVSRGQMATFLRNLVEQSGGTLAPASRDHFADDDGSVHEESINLVAEADIASGRPGGGFEPDSPVQRDQMATFLVNAYEYRTGERLPDPTTDAFSDDDLNVHETSIDQAAEAGFVAGVGEGRYAPGSFVRRDAMASFLSRVLDLLVEDGAATPPPVTAGDFDLTFGSRGTAEVLFGAGYAEALDVAETPDGGAVAVGFDSGDLGVVKLTADGRPDPAFGDDGRVTTEVGVFSIGSSVAVQPDGKVLVAGRTNPSSAEVDSDFLLVRYTADGELDPTFSGDGIVTSSYRGPADATELLLQPDGKVLVAGSALEDRAGVDEDLAVERYLPTGALDTAFGSSGRAVIDVAGAPDFLDGLALQDDGAIVAAGASYDPGASNEQSQATVVRLLTDGTLDTGFGEAGFARIAPGPFAGFTGVALQSDGAVVASGDQTTQDRTVSQVLVARFTPDGDLDTGFGDEGVVVSQPAPQAESSDIAVDAADRLVVVGRGLSDTNTQSGRSWLVLRFLPDGELDDAFSQDGQIRTALGRTANAVTIDGDGKLLVAGCDCPEPAFGRGGFESTSAMLVSRFRTED